MNTHILIILLLFLAPLAHASNNPIDDIRKMHQVYQQAEAFHIKMEITMFSSVPGEKATRTFAEVKYKGGGYYAMMDNTVNLLNKKGRFIVDNNSREMTLRPADDVAEIMQQFKVLPDEKLLLNENVSFLENTPERKRLKISVDDPSINHIELTLNRKGQMEEMSYHYTKATHIPYHTVTIKFGFTDLQPDFAKNEFSEEQYAKKTNGKWTPTGKYSTYQFFNQQ